MARRRHNTHTPRDRQKLVEDFERRVRFTREEGDLRPLLERPRSLAWVVHPLADQANLLAEIGIKPENCWSADAYWHYRDSVYFIRFNGSQPPDLGLAPYYRPPGIYYGFDRDHRQDIFDIFLSRPVITSADLHHVFVMLEAIIDSGQIEAERAALPDEEGRWIDREERLAEIV